MKPFNDYELRVLFDERKESIRDYIMSLSDEDILSEQDEIIANNMYEQYRFVPVIIEDEIIENRNISKIKIQKYNQFYSTMDSYYDEPKYFMIDGVEVISTFPYTGEELLFRCQASTFSLSGHPEINLYSNYLKISASETLDIMNKEENKELLFNNIKRDLEHLKKYIEYCNRDIESFNNSIKDYALGEIKKRKEKADKIFNISKMLEIPIIKNNPKLIEEIKIERKIVPLIKKTNVNTQEYAISDEIYNDILDMIKHQGSTFERTPQVYTKLVEEELRDIILGSLNTLFKGKANGESFRKKGKTDISIEYENRAAFVAECKIWAGKKVLKDALEQLQSYTTWRDNKLCLIMFSRNKNFFSILEEIKQNIILEENYVSYKEIDKNEFELKIKSKNNEGQIIKIRIFAFDISI